MADIFEQLDERSEEPETGRGDYAPWWDVDSDADEIMYGVIVDKHDEPDNYLDDGQVPNPVYTVVSLGKGDFEKGEARTTTTHKQMREGLKAAEVDDVVRIHAQGKQLRNDNATYVYEIGLIKHEEWQDSDDAELIEEVREEWDGIEGDNYEGEPVSKDEDDDSGSDDSDNSGGESSRGEAAEFLQDLVEMQDGEIDLDQADKMLNDVRDFDVDVSLLANDLGYEIEVEDDEKVIVA